MKLHVLYILCLVACGNNSETKVVNATDLVGYSIALDECRAEGKDAGKYSVYEECAKKADVKYGRKGDK